MSKQLTLSATVAILSMAAFAMVAGSGGLTSGQSDRGASSGLLFWLNAAQ